MDAKQLLIVTSVAAVILTIIIVFNGIIPSNAVEDTDLEIPTDITTNEELKWTPLETELPQTSSETVETQLIEEVETTIDTIEETTEEVTEEPDEFISLGTFYLTAYCSCEKCCGYWATVRPKDEYGNEIVYTASGAIAQEGLTIAVDPTVIPYGTEVIIDDHVYIAQDCGGGIKGNRIDVYFNNHETACKFAVRNAEVFIKNER